MKQEEVTEIKGRRAAAEFNGAPPAVREQFWQAIANQAEEVHETELRVAEEYDDPEAGRRAAMYAAENGRVVWDESWRRRCLSTVRARHWPEDDLRAQVETLRELPAPTYFFAIAGIEVPDRGGRVSCPMPDHVDQNPSCQVFPDERGWFCHACNRGGRAIELAAAVWGLETRGDDFVEVVERLGEVVGG